ncbi:MAG: DUF4886 domain-containing protein [Candidatus Aureabacteria bacterium]|nr:DUF4886 domain-containing protein [Candidatus Auribacterota bacterium]
MKKILFRISILILFVLSIFYFSTTYRSKKTVKVLFIGNSLISTNNLPGMVADIAKSHGYRVIYDSHTPGGARLKNHNSDAKVLQKIKERSWDFVVFQEQGQYPGFSKKQLSRDVFPYAKRLAQKVKKANDRSKVVFYMTMARCNGDSDNKNVSLELLTYEGTQKRVNRCYLEMGKDNKALIAPVGEVWRVVREKKPRLNLYSDGIHPNVTGTYLAACVFYTTLFDEPSVGSKISSGVDHTTAQYIQEVVDRIVLKQKGRRAVSFK